MRRIFLLFALSWSTLVFGADTPGQKGSFGYDVEFLKKHKNVIVLKGDNDSSQIAVVADYQGRVMTSTSDGEDGTSYGWLNHDLIASGELREHINVFGGEDRFWIGPEGGQFSIFFQKGADFNLDNWFTPAAIDTEPFDVVSRGRSSALFRKKMTLTNYSGFTFDVQIDRKVSVLTKRDIESELGIELGTDVKHVGFQSANEMINTGSEAWSKETGLLSIWILGMFNPSDQATIIIPFKGSLTLNSYFGEIPGERLVETDRAVFFKGDGKHRSKIGLPPKNIVPVCGSYDAENNLLTIVKYTFHGESDYVNSQWKLQDDPYNGDVVNSYNDGPVDDGSQLGPFYELESSSSAKELRSGERIKHVHKTYHFEGGFDDLNRVSLDILGVNLNDAAKLGRPEAQNTSTKSQRVKTPRQANQFVHVYTPAGDFFFGPDTQSLKEGQWYDVWVPNDHTFVQDDDGKWHIIGITHPYVNPDPAYGGIHQGEYASFHAVSSGGAFESSLTEHHYTDLPKILPPKERPGEPLANHAPYIVKRDGLYQMVYGPSPVRLAVSKDLSSWEPKGELFSQKGGARDPSLIRHKGTYYLSYCSRRSILVRSSRDLLNWSEATTIFTADSFDPESPSLVFYNDTFYLFVCSWDGVWDHKEVQGAYQHKTYVFQSDNLLDFGVGDEKRITTLNSHAPEIFAGEDGQWYISSVEWPNRGVSVDRLYWE